MIEDGVALEACRLIHNAREVEVMRARSVLPVIAAGLASACSILPAAVPVAGPQADLRQLEGEWVGRYSSSTDSREGSVIFELSGGRNVARGEVQMGPQMDRALTIEFVNIEEGFISGTLEPYLDPATRDTLVTTFRGRLEGNRINGTFVTVRSSGETVRSGTWSAAKADRARSSPSAPRITARRAGSRSTPVNAWRGRGSAPFATRLRPGL